MTVIVYDLLLQHPSHASLADCTVKPGQCSRAATSMSVVRRLHSGSGVLLAQACKLAAVISHIPHQPSLAALGL